MPLHFAARDDVFHRLGQEPRDPCAGGAVSFVGRVRAFNRQKKVAHLFYEAHESLAQKMFDELEATATAQFKLRQCIAVHRLGQVFVGEDAVKIAVLTDHRHEAFLASRFLIDELKKNLPIWKKEFYDDGSFTWDQTC
jgi:molybdopterin synthase catalytic subunit